MIAAACLLLLAPCQDLEDLATRLRGAVDKSTYDGNRAYTAAKELVELRSADAMKLRLELYDARWSTYRGVYLRDWFYSGMQRAASPAETSSV